MRHFQVVGDIHELTTIDRAGRIAPGSLQGVFPSSHLYPDRLGGLPSTRSPGPGGDGAALIPPTASRAAGASGGLPAGGHHAGGSPGDVQTAFQILTDTDRAGRTDAGYLQGVFLLAAITPALPALDVQTAFRGLVDLTEATVTRSSGPFPLSW